MEVPQTVGSVLTSTEASLIAKRYEAGATMKELADEFDVHKRTVAAHLQKLGVDRRVNARQMTDDQVLAAAAMYGDCVSLSKIGQQFNVDGSTVSRELRKIGVEIRPRGIRYG